MMAPMAWLPACSNRVRDFPAPSAGFPGLQMSYRPAGSVLPVVQMSAARQVGRPDYPQRLY
jgi:hypothetical protein